MAKSKKWDHLKDLAGHCRVLSILTLVFFGITSFILIVVCAASLGSDGLKFDFSSEDVSGQEKEQTNNAIVLIILTALAIVATVISLLFLFATFTDNMWLTIPYWLLLLVLMAFCLYQLLYFGFGIGRYEMEPPSFEESAFTRNIMQGGGVYIFSSMAFFGFLLYVFLPAFGYFLECRAKRAELIKKQSNSVAKLPVLPPPAPLAPHPILPPPPGIAVPLPGVIA